MGDIDLEPMRMVQEVEGPRPAKKKMRSNITVGMFDGGIIEDHVLLKGYAKENDVVNTTATLVLEYKHRHEMLNKLYL